MKISTKVPYRIFHLELPVVISVLAPNAGCSHVIHDCPVTARLTAAALTFTFTFTFTVGHRFLYLTLFICNLPSD